jgi:hypothetical protein
MPNEICILCGKETNVDTNTHIDYRYGYVEGAGQCCKECYNKTNNNTEEDYVTKTMRNRTTLITISAEDILSTPNDMELGAKVRQRYWELHGEQKPINQWVCGLCGKDTSDVDYDYLIGVDHLACHLNKESRETNSDFYIV